MNPHDYITDMRHRNPVLSHAQQQRARRFMRDAFWLIVGLVLGLVLGSGWK